MRTIRKEIEVAAAPAAVWTAWATAAGAVTFFAPEARIGTGHARWAGLPAPAGDRPEWPAAGRAEQPGGPPDAAETLRPGDPYELLFLDPEEAAEGARGSEGCRVLAHVPGEILAFDWNAPPQYAAVRAAERRAWVVVGFREADGSNGRGTRVRLSHLGFGEGAEWDAVAAYFERAWGTVLARLARRFAEGPVDWHDTAALERDRESAGRAAAG